MQASILLRLETWVQPNTIPILGTAEPFSSALTSIKISPFALNNEHTDMILTLDDKSTSH